MSLKSKFTRFTHVLLVVVLLISVGGAYIMPREVFAASADDMSNINPPAAGQEKGIWVDRGMIIIYANTFDGATGGGGTSKLVFQTNTSAGLNEGTLEYENNGGDCKRILKVTTTSLDQKPDNGTLKMCDGKEISVSLTKTDNAKNDGYYNGDEITMFRFLSGIDGCSAFTDIGSFSGKYASNGVFTKKGTDYREQKFPNSYVNNVSVGSGDTATAKQHNTNKNCPQANGAKTLSYAGNGASGGRTIWLAKGTTRAKVQEAAKKVVERFNANKVKEKKLKDLFATPEGEAALAKCGATEAAAITALLAEVASPLKTCLDNELKDNEDYQDAVSSTFDSGTAESPPGDNEADECNLGIPFIGDLVCKMVRLIFEGISKMFVAVIDYFGGTGDTFQQLDSKRSFQGSWEAVRNIANIVFIIAFLIVIFQYLTSLNVVDAYFVKKFLPRLLIAVVLVQGSWWIVREMNFIATDLGGSVRTIVLQGHQLGKREKMKETSL
jgi:hypothetical protein